MAYSAIVSARFVKVRSPVSFGTGMLDDKSDPDPLQILSLVVSSP